MRKSSSVEILLVLIVGIAIVLLLLERRQTVSIETRFIQQDVRLLTLEADLSQRIQFKARLKAAAGFTWRIIKKIFLPFL